MLLGLAERLVERAADYDAKLTRHHRNAQAEHALAFKRLSWDYFTLRVYLVSFKFQREPLAPDGYQAWRQDRLDLAKIMLAKFSLEELDPDHAETLADLTFEIGKDQSNKAAYNVALHWLEKAHHVIVIHNDTTLSADALDLMMSISYTIIKVLLKLGDEDARRRARNLFADFKLEYGDRLVVLLLELELLVVEPGFSVQEYGGTLKKIIRSVHVTDSNLKTIFHHIHKLKDKGSQVALLTVKALLAERLLSIASPRWIARAIVTATWIATNSQDTSDPMVVLRELLDLVINHSKAPLEADATHAAQMVMPSLRFV